MESTNTLLVHGANFNQENKLHFNPPLPADKFRQEVGRKGAQIFSLAGLERFFPFLSSSTQIGLKNYDRRDLGGRFSRLDCRSVKT